MIRMFWLALTAAALTGCGAGGSSAGAGNQGSGGSQLETGPTTATVAVGTQAATAATVLYAVAFKLHLPSGVTLPADPSSGGLAAGALHLADSGALAGTSYLPATATSQAVLQVNIADPGGFAVGSLATLHCQLAQGAAPVAASISLDDFSARDANGAVLPGITPQLSVQTQ